MKKYLLGILFGAIMWQLSMIHTMVIPLVKPDFKGDPLVLVLEGLGCPKEKLVDIAKATYLAGDQTQISPYLLAVLIYTESSFDYKAVSKKGYQGLMQTPHATRQWADVDVLHGARILQEKLVYSKGDWLQALSFYKGKRGSKEAKEQAKQVLSIYRRLEKS